MASSPVSQSERECPICDGTGWKMVQVPGRTTPQATRCTCRTDARTTRLLKSARIPARYERCTLENFETGANFHESLSVAKLNAVVFAEKAPFDVDLGLLFTGLPGLGKTHLAVGILQELIRSKGVQCLFVDYRDLLKEIQNSYNPSVQVTELEILRPVFDATVLLLDELGAIRTTEWVWDTVSHILNYRYSNKKLTLITTNLPDRPERKEGKPYKSLSKEEEARYVMQSTLGDRITNAMWSRLHEMCKIIELDGTDQRLQIKNQNLR